MHPHFADTARRSFGRSTLAIVLALGLAACGGDDSDPAADGAAAPAAAGDQVATSSPAVTSPSSTPFELRVSGGQFAGTHQLADNVTCTVDPGTWMVSSSRSADQGLTQVLLLIDGVEPTGGSSGEVSLMAHFGDVLSGSGPNTGVLTVDPAGGEGTGSATVRREGRGAVIEVDGTTGEGARVTAVARCAGVGGLQ